MKYNPDTIVYEKISNKVYEDFINNKLIFRDDIVNQVDTWISYIAFIFDLNFEASLKYVEEKGYVDKLVDRIDYKNEDTKLKMEQIRKCAKEYLNSNKIL